MLFEKQKIMNFDGAIRGLRNPLESWAKSDSRFGFVHLDGYNNDLETVQDFWKAKEIDEDNMSEEKQLELYDLREDWLTNNGELFYDGYNEIYEYAYIGPNDLDLMQRLIKAGPEHRKFMRQIFVCVDITAPRYWWTEYDTYKIGTVANSASTMHKIASRPITRDCFETDDYEPHLYLIDDSGDKPSNYHIKDDVDEIIMFLENLRQTYLKTKDKRYWKELIRWLPASWLQKRTCTLNYENLLSICHQRESHKLNEWSGKDNPLLDNFLSFAHTLPYADDLIFLK